MKMEDIEPEMEVGFVGPSGNWWSGMKWGRVLCKKRTRVIINVPEDDRPWDVHVDDLVTREEWDDYLHDAIRRGVYGEK